MSIIMIIKYKRNKLMKVKCFLIIFRLLDILNYQSIIDLPKNQEMFELKIHFLQ